MAFSETTSSGVSQLCSNWAFPQNFCPRKLGEIVAFYAVLHLGYTVRLESKAIQAFPTMLSFFEDH